MIDIVVLTNFSTAADKALLYARVLAKQVPSRLHLLHIWQHSILDANYFLEVPAFSSYFEDFPVSTQEEHEQALQKRVSEFGQDIAITPHFMVGALSDKLPAFLKQLDNPLVIIGKCYTENIPDELVESTSVQLLSIKNTPFLIVPERYQKLSTPKKIAVAIHEKEFKHRDHVFEELARSLQPEINIVHVASHPDETIKDRLAQHVETGLGIGVPEIQVIQKDNVMKGIQKYCKENEEDLLVLIHRKHSFLINLFRQSITGSFIRHSSIPLLILPG